MQATYHENMRSGINKNMQIIYMVFVVFLLSLISRHAEADCTQVVLNSTSQTFSLSAGSGTVGVSGVPTGYGGPCFWSVSSNAPWITVTPGNSGLCIGSVSYQISANTSTPISDRTGTLTICGQTFTVYQQAFGDATLNATVLGSPLTIKTSADMAGAIYSLNWNGKEFIDSADHGRELQSASQFNGFGECYNPTEAGNSTDGPLSNPSTSQLISLNVSGNTLSSVSKMAYWLKTYGMEDGNTTGCPLIPNSTTIRWTAQNTTALSDHTLTKFVTVGYGGLQNVIQYNVTYNVGTLPGIYAYPPIPGKTQSPSAVFESLTSYMPETFNTFWTYDPYHGILNTIVPNPLLAEQPLPAIVSTSDHLFAMGIWSPTLPEANYASNGYGLFDLGKEVKWNAVYRPSVTQGASYSYTNYVIIGTLQNVMQSMTALYTSFFPQSTTTINNVFRFYDGAVGEHFFTLNKNEVGAGATPPTPAYSYEGQPFSTVSTTTNASSSLYRCIWTKYGLHFISNDWECEGQTLEGSYGFVYNSAINGSVPLYRFYNPTSRDHLETTNYSEGSNAGYSFESILGYVIP